MTDRLTVFAPASVANVGPCYDLAGYALDYVGDFVTVQTIDRADEPLIWDGTDGLAADELENVAPGANVAWIVAQHIIKNHVEGPLPFSIKMRLHKYMPVSSGLGSSSASSVAAARAVVELLELNLDEVDLVHALEVGEAASCGSAHPDNVVPSYFGGFWFMCPGYETKSEGRKLYRLSGCERLLSVVVRPLNTRVDTAQARDSLHEYIAKEYIADGRPEKIIGLASMQAAKTADLVLAITNNRYDRLGWIMSHNEHLESARSGSIPRFSHVKRAALEAGALGCSISGSGPSVVAITDAVEKSEGIKTAMIDAFRIPSNWLISPVSQEGARVVDSIPSFIEAGRSKNNFMWR